MNAAELRSHFVRRRLTRVSFAALCFTSALGCQHAAQTSSPDDGAAQRSAPQNGTSSTKPAQTNAPGPKSDIRLVLWLTLDQFSPEYLQRFEKHVTQQGFGLLLERGASFTNANYAHAITETAPGHATLFTGASPSHHGIIGNSWLERETYAETTSVADPAYPLIGVSNGAQKGRSPKKLMVPTIGDAMISADSRSKVIAIATKDRSAILPGGAKGKAFFLESAGYVTSRYYGTELPGWVSEFNRAHSLEGHRGSEWKLTLPEDQYLRKADDNHAWEHPPGKLGNTFPHRIDGEGTLESVISTTPFGDELSTSLALSALEAEGLGTDDAPDLLSLSLSATDAIGHSFGPESLEAEDNFVRLDRTLAKLLDAVMARVGEAHVLVVVSADHGAPESPEALKAEKGERVPPSTILEAVKKAAAKRYRKAELVRAVTVPYVWLDRALVSQAKLDPAQVARELGEDLKKTVPSMQEALSTWDPLPEGELFDRARESIYPDRSGDIYVVLKPYKLFLQHAGMASTHGSPWPYDTHVPIIVLGPRLPQGRFERAVDPRSIAPTVAALLGVPAPAAASKAPLKELLSGRTVAPGSDTP